MQLDGLHDETATLVTCFETIWSPKLKKIKCVVPVTAILLFGALASANAQIITYSNRATFNTAFGSTTVEDFTSNFHFPITTGVLNSATNLVVSSGTPIVPGDIKAGVTYSTPVQAGNFFNIDAGGGYVGGFLDSAVGGTPVLTATFNGPVKAFGFDTNDLMGAFKVTINYGGTPYVAQPFNGAGFTGSQVTIRI